MYRSIRQALSFLSAPAMLVASLLASIHTHGDHGGCSHNAFEPAAFGGAPSSTCCGHNIALPADSEQNHDGSKLPLNPGPDDCLFCQYFLQRGWINQVFLELPPEFSHGYVVAQMTGIEKPDSRRAYPARAPPVKQLFSPGRICG